MSGRLEFGVNLNNREPLIAPDYDLGMLLDLSEVVEERGFDSVWVGDSLFSKPRYEPIALLAAISQRTSQVKLGTACMVSSTRNPLYLALEWATLDQISGGRTILGTGMGNPEELAEQLDLIRAYADEEGADFERLVISYQVTMNVGDSEDEARAAFRDYISKYYPELSKAMDLSNWGPVGTPDQIADWIRTFADAGVDHFICRFGAIDQFDQVERFAGEVLPRFVPERVR